MSSKLKRILISVIDFIGRKPDGLALWMNADIFVQLNIAILLAAIV
jgi:hypothetical protein